MVISYSLRRFEVFLKVPVVIMIRFGENNVLGPIYIDIYINFDVGLGGGGRTWFTLTLLCVLFIKKTKNYKRLYYLY